MFAYIFFISAKPIISVTFGSGILKSLCSRRYIEDPVVSPINCELEIHCFDIEKENSYKIYTISRLWSNHEEQPFLFLENCEINFDFSGPDIQQLNTLLDSKIFLIKCNLNTVLINYCWHSHIYWGYKDGDAYKLINPLNYIEDTKYYIADNLFLERYFIRILDLYKKYSELLYIFPIRQEIPVEVYSRWRDWGLGLYSENVRKETEKIKENKTSRKKEKEDKNKLEQELSGIKSGNYLDNQPKLNSTNALTKNENYNLAIVKTTDLKNNNNSSEHEKDKSKNIDRKSKIRISKSFESDIYKIKDDTSPCIVS